MLSREEREAISPNLYWLCNFNLLIERTRCSAHAHWSWNKLLLLALRFKPIFPSCANKIVWKSYAKNVENNIRRHKYLCCLSCITSFSLRFTLLRARARVACACARAFQRPQMKLASISRRRRRNSEFRERAMQMPSWWWFGFFFGTFSLRCSRTIIMIPFHNGQIGLSASLARARLSRLFHISLTRLSGVCVYGQIENWIEIRNEESF